MLMLLQYIGEEGSKCEFKAAAVLSSPWNLEAGSLALQRTWIGLNVYSKAMGSNLKGLFERYCYWPVVCGGSTRLTLQTRRPDIAKPGDRCGGCEKAKISTRV